MTLVAEQGVITSPGATGNQTTNLGAAFNGILPKVLFLTMTYDTADGAPGADGILTRGIGTFNGGAAQNIVQHWFDDDGTTAEQHVNYFGTDAILKGVIADGTTQDFACTLSSLNSGTPSNFVLNWSDLPGTGSIRIHYLVLGGTDISAARCGSFTMSTAAATQDVTVTAGFGQPDVLLFYSNPWTAAGAFNTTDGRIMFGAAKDGTERRCTLFGGEDGSANMALASWQKARAGLGFTATTGAADFEADLSSKASWPTDGFQWTYTDQASFAFGMGYLAIKGTLACTIGNGTVPTSGTTPVAQNLTLSGGTPKAAIFWGTSIPANASIDTTHTDLGSYFQGSTDGTNEGVAGVCQDDANAASQAGRFFSATKVIRHYTNAGTPALQSECDSSFSGSDVVLSWNDIDSVAREFNYIIFGEPASGTDHSRNADDTLGLTDARAFTQGKKIADTLGLTDVGTVSRVLNASKSDTLGLTDARALAQGKAIADTLGLTDSAAPGGTAHNRTPSDTFGLTDVGLVSRQAHEEQGDMLGLTDARAFVQGKVIAETFGLTDARAFVQSHRLTETFGLTDARAFTQGKKLAETFSLTDSATPNLTSGGSGLSRTPADTFGLTDALTRQAVYARTQADTLGLTDAAARTSSIQRPQAETLSLTDALTRQAVYLRTAPETFGLTDSVVPFMGELVIVTDDFSARVRGGQKESVRGNARSSVKGQARMPDLAGTTASR